MGFFKNLFGKKEEGEPFIATPTQTIPGLEPIIVQAIENIYSDAGDQEKAFAYAREYKASKYGSDKKYGNSTLKLLAMFADTSGRIERLPDPTLWSDGHFNGDLADTFSKMKDAEAWVKSITKTQG